MTPRQRARARELFQQLLDLPESEQIDTLAAACPDDPEVFARVSEMLKEDRAGGASDFAPLVSPSDASQLAASIAESPGTTIGPYRIVRVLGEGGFGTVLLAEQSSPIQREVALKVVKLGMDTRQVIARFRLERQAMALLDHPNIAKVFDAGATDTGRPYFAMEVCPGEPITKYCDSLRLTIEQRIAIVCTVCRAVHHAHQRGLIHRDLKPSNILVSQVDGKPVPKVIDFGIAKAMRQDLQTGTMMSVQHQFIGTPEYTSPEQAYGESDVDTRADVYSLGVLLYELLTGETPVSSEEFRTASGQSLQKVILESKVIAPSTRFLSSTDQGTKISQLRATEPSKLRQQLRRELDWVVLRAIEKDRNRRYDSAAELATELERYLRGEAVLAAPPSTWYALRKSARKHRTVVIAAGLILATLSLGVVGTLSQARQARKEAAAARAAQAAQKVLAEAEAQRSQELQEVAEFQARMLGSLDPFTIGSNLASDMRSHLQAFLEVDQVPEAQRASLIAGFNAAMDRLNTADIASDLLDREILQPSIRAIEENFADQPRVRGLLQTDIANSYNGLSMRAESLDAFAKAIKSLSEGFGPDDPRVLAVQLRELMIHIAMYDAESLEPKASNLLEKAQRVLKESDPLRLSIEREWAATLWHLDKPEESLAFYKSVLEKCLRFLPPSSEVTLLTATKASNVLISLERYQEAETLLLENIQRASEHLGEKHELILPIKLSLTYAYSGADKDDESLRLLDELIDTRTSAMGRQNVRTINPLLFRSRVLMKLGRFDESEADCQQLIVALGSRQGFDYIRIAVGRRMGRLLARKHEYAAAEEVIERQIQFISPKMTTPLLRELRVIYDNWSNHDPSVDLVAKQTAILARIAQSEPYTESAEP